MNVKHTKTGFTLAEVLITLAIIGVVAALSIPAVISNSQQQEFKTGLRKAVSVLNSAITMNMALDGESPYDNANLPGYLMKHMNVIQTVRGLKDKYYAITYSNDGSIKTTYDNGAFYTTDGMRFEFDRTSGSRYVRKLHESNTYACDSTNVMYYDDGYDDTIYCNGCGSYGLKTNDATGKPPCFIMVDVNGDKKPTPANVNCRSYSCQEQNVYKVPYPSEKKVNDIFGILITEEKAIPYGVTAQKAMYQAQK